VKKKGGQSDGEARRSYCEHSAGVDWRGQKMNPELQQYDDRLKQVEQAHARTIST